MRTLIFSFTILAALGFGSTQALAQITADQNPASVGVPVTFSGANAAWTVMAGSATPTSSGGYSQTFTITPTAPGSLEVRAVYGNQMHPTIVYLTIGVSAQPVSFTISPISFTYNGGTQGPAITPSVGGATYSTSGTTSATAAGSYSVTATANGNYSGSGSTGWTIAQATPVVSWSPPAPITYGTALSSTQLDASANVAGSFSYAPPAGTILTAGSYTLSVTFTPADTADYTSASASVSLTVNPQPVTFSISPVSFTYNRSSQGPAITPSVAGANYSTSGTASATAAGSYSVTATATGNYTGSGSASWTIAKANAATPTVTASANPSTFPATITFTPGGGTTGAYVWSINGNNIATYNGSSWSPGSGTYATGTWSISGLNLLISPTSATNYTVVFSDTGNGNYNPASSATIAETVNPPLQAAAPVFSLGSGNYTGTQTVAITSATSGASIRYTTDGSAPSETNGTIYSGPVSIGATAVLKAIAYENGYSDSTVTSANYTVAQAIPPQQAGLEIVTP